MKKRIAFLLLALVMAVGLVSGALAFTSNTGASAVMQADLPLGIFLGNQLGNISLVESTYYYDRGLGRYVQSYALSDSSKLCLLLDECMPIYKMSDTVARLKANNLIGSLDKYLDSNQKVTIWGSLSQATQNRIRTGQMNALEALNYIKTSSGEYKSNSTLKKYVDYYLSTLLDGSELRTVLKVLDPNNSALYDSYNVTQLISRGETLLTWQRVTNLLAAMRPFRDISTKPYDLERSYTAQQIASYYSTLSSAAGYFYPSYVNLLNNYRFTVNK